LKWYINLLGVSGYKLVLDCAPFWVLIRPPLKRYRVNGKSWRSSGVDRTSHRKSSEPESYWSYYSRQYWVLMSYDTLRLIDRKLSLQVNWRVGDSWCSIYDVLIGGYNMPTMVNGPPIDIKTEYKTWIDLFSVRFLNSESVQLRCSKFLHF
jgi:hypothetical protein